MKFRSKAGVPIGTIAIIIIVLVASLGMWWYFTQRGEDCSDVRQWCTGYSTEGDCLHHSYAIKDGTSNQYVKIQWWEPSQWRATAYIETSGSVVTFIWFDDPDNLNEWVQNHGSFSDEQKVDTARMIDCIKAGCPNCREL